MRKIVGISRAVRCNGFWVWLGLKFNIYNENVIFLGENLMRICEEHYIFELFEYESGNRAHI